MNRINKSEQNVFVVLSSINPPNRTTVVDSLIKLRVTGNIYVITSNKFFNSWKKITPLVHEVMYDSTSKSRVFLRKFLLRSKILRLLIRFLINLNSWCVEPQILMQPHSARHFEYLKVLNKLKSDDWVFLVDSRDLIFQVSPVVIAADLAKKGNLHVFDERSRFFKDGKIQKNRSSAANWKWAQQVSNYDSSLLDPIANNWILNSGCIAGTVSALSELLLDSCGLLANSIDSPFALLDQGSLNVLSYSNKYRHKVTLNENGKVVLNMCGVPTDKFENIDGIMMCEGRTIPIVHQFDRFGVWTSESGLVLNRREFSI